MYFHCEGNHLCTQILGNHRPKTIMCVRACVRVRVRGLRACVVSVRACHPGIWLIHKIRVNCYQCNNEITPPRPDSLLGEFRRRARVRQGSPHSVGLQQTADEWVCSFSEKRPVYRCCIVPRSSPGKTPSLIKCANHNTRGAWTIPLY